jgi:hypothetical protein
MKFIEMTGKQLQQVITEGEFSGADLRSSGITESTIIRVNPQGDIEVRRPDRWDVIGGLLGDYQQRLRQVTGLEYA